MKIESIDINNFNNTKSGKYCFNPNLNYIVGPNGSGKSTILQAIILSILGYIPGTSKKVSDIFTHSNNNKNLSVKCQLTDGICLERDYYNTSKGDKVDISSTINIEPEEFNIEDEFGNVGMTLLNLSEFLSLTQNKQKDAMLEMLPSFSQTKDMEKHIINTCHDIDNYNLTDGYIDEVISDILDELSNYKTINNIEQLKSINSELKEMQTANNSELKRLQSTIQSLVYYDDFDDNLDLEELQNSFNHFTELLNESKLVQNDLDRKENIEDQISNLTINSDNIETDPNYILYIDKANKLKNIINDINDKLNEARNSSISLDTQAKQYKQICENTSDGCPILKIECDKLDEYSNKIVEEVEQLDIKYKELERDINSLEESKSEYTKELEEIELAIKAIEKDYAQYEMLTNQLNELHINTNLLAPKIYEDKVNELFDQVTKCKANQQYNELANKLNIEAAQLDFKKDCIKALIKETGENGLQSELMLEPFNNLEKEMGNVSKSLDINLGDPKFILESKANSFNFGVMRQDKFIPFYLLSSGEKCIFTLMLLVGLIEICDSKLRVIMIDDLFDHLDDSNFTTIIKNISTNFDIQFIFAGVKIPENMDRKAELIRIGD